jgi:hypothetical protein
MVRTPATVVWLAVLVATTVYLARHPQHAAAILRANSTNLHQLARLPVQVLLTSPLWLSSHTELVVWSVLFPVVLAPLERWLGTLRWLFTAATGHVGASLVTAAVSVFGSVAEYGRLANLIDVGASYGVCALAAVTCLAVPRQWWLVGRLPRHVGVALLGTLTVVLLFVAVTHPDDLTAWGHLAAVGFGISCWPVCRQGLNG